MTQITSENMARIRNLVCKGGWYHCRLTVPLLLQPFIPNRKTELWTTLNTNSRSVANQRLTGALARQQAQLEGARAEARAKRVQTETIRCDKLLTSRQLADAHYNCELALDEKMRVSGAYDPSYRDWSKTGYTSALRRVASGAAPDGECDAVIGWAIDVFTANGNATAKRGTPERRALARQLAAIQLEIEKRKNERDLGESNSAPRHELLTMKPVETEVPTGDGSKTLREILPDFIKERRPSARTIYEYNLAVSLFGETLGQDKPIYRIKCSEIIAFKKALQDLPAT